MSGSDLSQSQKWELLDHLRNQVGQTTYDKMVDAYGEDGLVELFIRHASQLSTSKPASARSDPSRVNPWQYGLLFPGWVITAFAWGIEGWLGLVFGIIMTVVVCGPVTFIVLPSLYVLGVIFFSLRNAIGNKGMLWIGFVSVLGVASYGVWMSFPWLASGVRQWWTWLGGHFH